MATHIASDIIQGEMSNIIRNPKASVRYSLDLLEKFVFLNRFFSILLFGFFVSL